MTQAFDHLHTGVWSFLDESQEGRITRLYMPKWVSYARANEALARMEHLLRHPPCGRMPSMLLYGDSDIGKTMVVDKFVRDHPNICTSSARSSLGRFFGCRCRPNPMTANSMHRSSKAWGTKPPSHAEEWTWRS